MSPTPRERFDALQARRVRHGDGFWGSYTRSLIECAIAAAESEARESEREACAKAVARLPGLVAEGIYSGDFIGGYLAACNNTEAAILRRGKGGGTP